MQKRGIGRATDRSNATDPFGKQRITMRSKAAAVRSRSAELGKCRLFGVFFGLRNAKWPKRSDDGGVGPLLGKVVGARRCFPSEF